MAKTSGDCYKVNGKYFIDNYIKNKNLRLVHGNAILASDGKPYGHCWLEDGNMVLDFSNGHSIKLNKKVYYKAGGIPSIPGVDNYYYDQKTFSKRIIKYGHWGPWDNNPPR